MKNGLISAALCCALALPASAIADHGRGGYSSYPTPAPAARRGPDQTALRWHVIIDGQQVGPLNRDMIAAFVEAGLVGRRTQVSTPGIERRGGDAFAYLAEHPLFSDLAPERRRGGHHGRWGEDGGGGRWQPQRTNWAQQPAVIAACGEAFTGSTNEIACLDAVSSAPADPVGLIGACEEAMEGDANELACLQVGATSASLQLVAGLAACADAMEGDANELACFKEVVKAPSYIDPAPTIAACERGMSGDAAELACIEQGLASPRRRW